MTETPMQKTYFGFEISESWMSPQEYFSPSLVVSHTTGVAWMVKQLCFLKEACVISRASVFVHLVHVLPF